MELRHIEHPHGNGRLLIEGTTFEVVYDIDVYQEFLSTRRPGDNPIPGVKDIRNIKIVGLDDSTLWRLQGKTGTLQLEDGRKLDVEVQFSGEWLDCGGDFQ